MKKKDFLEKIHCFCQELCANKQKVIKTLSKEEKKYIITFLVVINEYKIDPQKVNDASNDFFHLIKTFFWKHIFWSIAEVK